MSASAAAVGPAVSPRANPAMHTRRSEQIAQGMIAALLYAAPALACAYAGGVQDPDVWWHLSTARWIVQHHAVPRVDPFSSTTMGHPWAAYSWLFDLLVYGLYRGFGLFGIVAYAAGMTLAVTAALHRMVRRVCADFNAGVLITFAACFSMTRLESPRPWLWSTLLFTLELDILADVAANGRTRRLLWLPLLFALWSNLHIQFMDGLVVLFLLLGVALGARWASAHRVGTLRVRVSARQLALTAAACLAAVCVNPYGWRIYGEAWSLATQPGVLDLIQELAAIPFRSLGDFCTLGIALGAAGLLARRGRVLSFEGAAFAFAAVVAFRSQRDVWVMAVVGALVLASGVSRGYGRSERRAGLWSVASVVMAVLLTGVGAMALRINSTRLHAEMAESLPVHAAAYIRDTDARAPLFNDYTWGGYLMWALPEPVEMDGRAALHGTAQLNRSVATWRGTPSWAADRNLQTANTVVGPVDASLMQLLRTDPRFRLAFADKTADVFVRVRPAE